MLDIQHLTVRIQQTEILRDVSLTLEPGSMVGLIGRNGAGKTTLMRSVMGLIRARAGSVRLGDDDLLAVGAERRAALGVGYLPEDRRLVPELSVEENILVPGWANHLPKLEARLERVYQILPEVREFRDRRALQVSGGQQKLVALARALIPGERLLLLDEPFEGIAPALAQRLVEVIAALRGDGLCVLLSESDYTHSAALVDKVYVIERGEVSAGRVEAA